MPRKAIDADPIAYFTMLVCFELGKTEKELEASGWTTEDVFRWVAFLRLKNKAEKKAIDAAKRKGGR